MFENNDSIKKVLQSADNLKDIPSEEKSKGSDKPNLPGEVKDTATVVRQQNINTVYQGSSSSNSSLSGKSLLDSINKATSSHKTLISEAETKIQDAKTAERIKECKTLLSDCEGLTRDFSEKYPDLLEGQAALNTIDPNVNDKMSQGFKRTATKVVSDIKFHPDTNMEGGGKAVTFHIGPENSGHNLTVTSTRGTFFDNKSLDTFYSDLKENEASIPEHKNEIEALRTLSGVAHNYMNYSENVQNRCVNRMNARTAQVEQAMQTGKNLEESVEAAKSFDKDCFENC